MHFLTLILTLRVYRFEFIELSKPNMFRSAPNFSASIFCSKCIEIRVAQDSRLRNQMFHGDTKIHEDEFVHPFGEVEAPSKPNFGNEVFAESFLIGH